MRNIESMHQNKLRIFDVEVEYGVAYFSAISKLSAKSTSDAYDENGILKDEYVLTDFEKEALLCYLNRNQSSFSSIRKCR